MQETMEQLENLKSHLEGIKEKRGILIGKLEVAQQHLKDLGLDSVEDAEKEIVRIGKEAKKLKKELEDKIVQFKEEYGALFDDIQGTA